MCYNSGMVDLENKEKNNFFEDQSQASDSRSSLGVDTGIWPVLLKKAKMFLARFSLKGVLERYGIRPVIFYIILSGLILILPLNFILNKWVEPAIFNNYFSSLSYTSSSLEEVVVEEVNVVPRTDDTAVAVVQLSNKNRGYGVSNFGYIWRGLDDSNEVLFEKTKYTFILPNQNKFLVLPIKEDLPTKIAFEVLPHENKFTTPALANSINLTVVNTRRSNEDGQFVLTGQVVNNTDYIFYKPYLTVLIRDSSNKIIAAMSTQISEIKPGEVSDFSLTWPQTLPENVVEDVRVSVNKMSELEFNLYSEELDNGFQDR